jgi:hypothetical protein
MYIHIYDAENMVGFRDYSEYVHIYRPHTSVHMYVLCKAEHLSTYHEQTT